MFTVKDGKIVITSVETSLSQVYTPAEWNVEMLRLLDERQMALNNLAMVKMYDDHTTFPSRPERMGIAEFIQWKTENDKAVAISDRNLAQIKTYRNEIDKCEEQIVRLMPINEKLFIADEESPCMYSVWWTTRFEAGRTNYDLRIETLKHLARVTPAPETIPLSQQLDGDDLESDLENALWDDEEEIGGFPSEYSGENDEPPAPTTVNEIPF